VALHVDGQRGCRGRRRSFTVGHLQSERTNPTTVGVPVIEQVAVFAFTQVLLATDNPAGKLPETTLQV